METTPERDVKPYFPCSSGSPMAVEQPLAECASSDHTLVPTEGEDNETRTSFSKIDSLNVVGQDCQILIEMLTNLEHLGIDGTNDVRLPKIVVVGDQSAGKSSLIEAISEIRVPRSSGTCTRCPLQISLIGDSKVTSWSCKVKLQRLYDYDKVGCDPRSPFFPWQEKSHPLTVTFSEVFDKNALEEILVRAQVAILNPAMDPSNFLTLPLHTLADPSRLQVKFSPNIICLDIYAPNLPSLAFYDLPGIINQTEDADEIHLVSLVENLAEKYVKDQDALVLLACSLEGDIANSSAARLVRKFCAVDRCVGVLTKPDRFPKGDDVSMIDLMLQGSKYQLGHGYFITKQPGQADLVSVSHSDARIQERNFFERESPWQCPQLLHYRDRFGTEKLQAALSQKLAAMIVRRFSTIWNTIKSKKAELEHQLSIMPQPPKKEESHTRVNMLLLELNKEMERHAKGEDPEFSSFLYDFKYTILKGLREELRLMKPILKLSSQQGIRYLSRDVQSSPRKQPVRGYSGDSDSDAYSGDIGSKKRKIDSITSVSPSFMEEPKMSSHALKCTPEDINKALSQYSVVCGIGSEDNPRALDKLRLKSLEKIHLPAADFISGATRLLKKYTQQSLEHVMNEWRTTLLFKELQQMISTFITDAMERQIQQAEHEVGLEKLKPMTCDEDGLERLEQEELELMEKNRHIYRVKQHLYALYGPEKFLATQQREFDAKSKDERLRAELGPDPLRHEIRVMAKVKAYYTLATNRLVDFLVRHMHLELFELFRTHQFYSYLMDVTRPRGEEDVPTRCSILLADDAERENQRRILQHQKDAMEEAWKYLQEAYDKFKGK